MDNNKLNIFNKDFNGYRFMVGPREIIKKMVDFGRIGFSSNMFRNTKSVAEILRAFYLSKRLPREMKEFLNQWYVILLESLAIISADKLIELLFLHSVDAGFNHGFNIKLLRDVGASFYLKF